MRYATDLREMNANVFTHNVAKFIDFSSFIRVRSVTYVRQVRLIQLNASNVFRYKNYTHTQTPIYSYSYIKRIVKLEIYRYTSVECIYNILIECELKHETCCCLP